MRDNRDYVHAATSALIQALAALHQSRGDPTQLRHDVTLVAEALRCAKHAAEVIGAVHARIIVDTDLMPWWEKVVALCEHNGKHDKQPGFAQAREMRRRGLTPEQAYEECIARPDENVGD